MEKRLEDIHEKVDELVLSRRRVKEVLVVLDKDENDPEATDYVLKDQTSRRTQNDAPPVDESPVAAPVDSPVAKEEVEADLPPPSSSGSSPDLVPNLTPDSTPSEESVTPPAMDETKPAPQNNKRRLVTALYVTAVAAAVMDLKSGEKSKLRGPIAAVIDTLAPTSTITDFQLVTVTKTSTAKPACKTATRTLTESFESTRTITKSVTQSITLPPPKASTIFQTKTETLRQTVTKQSPAKSDTESLVQALRLNQLYTSEDRRILKDISRREW